MAWPLVAAAVISIGSGVISGVQKKKAAEAEADMQRQQGALLFQESLRDASIVRKEGDIFAQKQSLQYIGMGFKLGGSALITMKDTRIKAGAQADSIVKRGRAQKDLAFQRADLLDEQGRTALITSILGGASSALSSFGGGGSAGTDAGTIATAGGT